ncbi:hypothetical protein P261_02904 [Lachnospiraceae bacterium TWA4]|nr:hypothetical protein P261_02904 [Lachnospiraceae bacterium TWA4]
MRLMNQMIKIIKAILITIGVLFILAILFISLLEYEIVYKVSDIGESISPNQLYKVEFQKVGQSVGFGNQSSQLVLSKDKNKISTVEFDIANDGKKVTENDWKTEWFKNRVEVILSGEEQNDVLVILYFDGSTDTKHLNTKYGKEIPQVKKEKLTERQNESTYESKTEDYTYIYQIEEGYLAIYNDLYESTFSKYEVVYGASMRSSRCILYEK